MAGEASARRKRLPKSWRVCPYCKGRATKLFNISTRRYLCQQCDREYVHGERPPEWNWLLRREAGDGG
jgi:transposase-like protein